MLLLSLATVSCDDDDDDIRERWRDAGNSGVTDSGQSPVTTLDASQVPGVCELPKCPAPDIGIACCTPDARCGTDLFGNGSSCLANPDVANPKVCRLADCPLPDVGLACCLPNGDCGTDPFGSHAVCFANPPPVNVDAGPVCDPRDCPQPVTSGVACCTITGACGVDTSGTGFFCAANPAQPPVSGPPDHPSVTGECASFVGVNGIPVWGCCSIYGVCGTFAQGACLLAAGTPLPTEPLDENDAGMLPLGYCHAPAIE